MKYETEEEEKDINIKKFFQFLESHVQGKEAPDNVKDLLRGCNQTSQETVEHLNYMRVWVCDFVARRVGLQVSM